VYFQNIDDKRECAGAFFDSPWGRELVFEKINLEGFTRTWKYSESLREHEHLEFAWLYVAGRSLDSVCPDSLRNSWESATKKLEAYKKSLSTAKVSLTENCIFDIIPKKFLLNYLYLKNEITKSVFENHSRPQNYDHLLGAHRMIEEIRFQAVSVDRSAMKARFFKKKVRHFMKDLNKKSLSIRYNLFGTKTGRLTTERGSFPILTLDKDLREFIKPNHDAFLEIDFNAAELRTLLALVGTAQPEEDVHNWNIKNIFGPSTTREEAKKRVFSWLYNPDSKDFLLNRAYDRVLIKEKYWDGQNVTTPFLREIESDEYHSVNYILQSTTSDVCLEQASKVHKFLKNMKSKIAFIMHDSIVLDVTKEEKNKIPEIVSLFENTRFGKYMVNVKLGKNFGDMKEIKWIR
jgi:hypothetical protein